MPAATAWRLDDDLALVARLDGRLQARGRAELSGFSGLLGGYTAALALDAMAAVVGDVEWVPRAINLVLPAPVYAGEVLLTPRLERRGGSLASTSVRVEQGDAVVAHGTATFGAARPSPAHVGLAMPHVPPPLDCPPVLRKPVPEAQAGTLVEHRAAGPLPLAGGRESRILVWMRLVEERPIDAAQACVLADQTPPGLFGSLTRFVPIPSVELTYHFGDVTRAAQSAWVLGDIRTIRARDGYAVEDAELWTPAGELVLTLRHLRRILSGAPRGAADSGGADDLAPHPRL